MSYQKVFWLSLLISSILRWISNYQEHKEDWKNCRFDLGLWECIEFSSLTLVLFLNISGFLFNPRRFPRRCLYPFLTIISLIQFWNFIWTVIGTYWIVYTIREDEACIPEIIKPYQLVLVLSGAYMYWSLISCSVGLFGVLMLISANRDMFEPGLEGMDIQNAGRRPLGAEEIKKIKTEKTEENMICSICLENVEPGTDIKVLPGCFHRFHIECIDLWLARSAICPYCRRPVTAEDIMRE